MVVQCVQVLAYPPVRLKRRPTDDALSDQQGRLVFIAQNLSATAQQDIEARLAELPGDDAAMRLVARSSDSLNAQSGHKSRWAKKPFGSTRNH